MVGNPNPQRLVCPQDLTVTTDAYRNETCSQSDAFSPRQHGISRKGLDAEHSSPVGSGEYFALDIAFYRTRLPILGSWFPKFS
jgi:hypothetical protein